MRFFTLLALAGAAVAAPELQKRQSTSANATGTAGGAANTASIYGVLITALPSSLLAEATNTAKLSSDIANQFKTTTPGWFSSLPPDVQSYLIAQGGGTASGSSGALSTGAVGSAGTGASSSVTATSNASTVASPTLSSTSSESSSGSSASSAAASSSSSTGGASLPTAVVGGGIAGLVGLVGMLAL